MLAGGVETGRALVQGDTDKVIFIGSTGVGRAVMKDAADSLTPVTLELGGKDPFIVCSDAKLSDVVPTALRAAFQSCGQNCVAAERYIVHEDVYEDFLSHCSSVVKKMRQGDPLGEHCASTNMFNNAVPAVALTVYALVLVQVFPCVSGSTDCFLVCFDEEFAV